MKHTVIKIIQWPALAAFLCVVAVAVAFFIQPGLSAQAAYSGYPTFSIVAITADQKVTIETHNLPPNDRFDVRMGPFGSLGWGTYVTTIDSAGGGKIQYEFQIPTGLRGHDRIAIRIDSPASGYYAYNWFWNTPGTGTRQPTPTKPAATPTATGTPKATAPAQPGYPYFFIASVTRNEKVRIEAYNFPANDTFEVTMDFYGTLGRGGYKVDTVTTDGSGKLSSLTFDVPDPLAGQNRIAIRLQSARSGYYAFNWFWNFNAP
ncbi:MAG: hypothetical protein ACOYYS_08010 [Chloroflexota bacterium]